MLFVALPLEVVVNHGAEKNLVLDRGTATVACHHGHDRGKVAARGGAGDGDAGGVNAEVLSVLGRPDSRSLRSTSRVSSSRAAGATERWVRT